MEFGLFTEFASPPGVSDAAAFDGSLGQMRAAEDMSYDAVWLAEIHLQKDRSVLASPLGIAAALAACTRRVKIGIAVQVLPLSHRRRTPWWDRSGRPFSWPCARSRSRISSATCRRTRRRGPHRGTPGAETSA